MQLLLIRHAHALDGGNDAARPLSERGRRQIRRLAQFLKRTKEFEAEEIWHSPIVRSRDSATLLRQLIGMRARLVESNGLAPHDDPTAMADRLKDFRIPLAIVGHEPHLSALASLLITGTAKPPVFVLKKCAALALARERGRWVARWHVAPALLK